MKPATALPPDDVVNWGLGGDITVRMLATNVMKFITNPGFIGGVITESAGTNSGNTPHWKLFFTQAYDTDAWGFFVNERWFSEGVINRNWVACATCLPGAGGHQPSHRQQQLHAGRALFRHRRPL